MLPMERLFAVFFAALFLSACAADGRGLSVTLVYDSIAVPLTLREQSALRRGAEAILTSCNNNSEVHNEFISWPPVLAEEWNRILAADHLLIEFARPEIFTTVGGIFEVRALLLPLPPGQLPGQPLTQGERTVGYSKCSGTLMIVDFSCIAPIEQLMPASYQEFCQRFRAAEDATSPVLDQ